MSTDISEDPYEYYKKELTLFGTIFGIALLFSLIITFFSYQKSIGNTGFLEHLSSFVRSFAYTGSEYLGTNLPVSRAIFFSSLYISTFVVIVVILSKLVLFIDYKVKEQNIIAPTL